MMTKIRLEKVLQGMPRIERRAIRSPIRRTRKSRKRIRSRRKSLTTASVLKKARVALMELPIAIGLPIKRVMATSENQR